MRPLLRTFTNALWSFSVWKNLAAVLYCSGTAESVQQGWGGVDTRVSAWYWFHTCTISLLQVCSSWVPRAWHISYLSATRESKCSHYVRASWTREGHWHPGRADSDTCHTPLSCSSWALVQSSSQAVVEVVLHWHCCGNRLVLCLIHWLEEVQKVRVLSSFNEGRVSHEKQH